MSDTNIHDEHMDEQTFLTRSQVEELFRELEEHRARERDLRTTGTELPLAISETLDNSSPTQLKDNLKQYKKTVQRYNHDTWTKAEQINKEFISDLKRWKVDAHQLVNTIHKITETTRVQASASTELFEQLQYLQSRAEFASPKDRDIFKNTAEQALRLAIHGFSSAKQQEKEAKEIATKALNLPSSIKHLEYSTDDDGKTNAFDNDFVERLERARFEDKVTRDAASFGRGTSNSYQSFTKGTRGGWRGNWSSNNSFHYGGRGRGTHTSGQHRDQSSQKTKDSTTNDQRTQ